VRKIQRKGQAMVEYALLLPIFFLVFFGIIDFALTMHCWSTLNLQCSNAARAGTKRVNQLIARDFITENTHATLAEVQTAFDFNRSPLMPASSYSNLSIVGPGSNLPNVTVSVDFKVTMWTPLISAIMGDLTIHATAVERKE